MVGAVANSPMLGSIATPIWQCRTCPPGCQISRPWLLVLLAPQCLALSQASLSLLPKWITVVLATLHHQARCVVDLERKRVVASLSPADRHARDWTKASWDSCQQGANRLGTPRTSRSLFRRGPYFCPLPPQCARVRIPGAVDYTGEHIPTASRDLLVSFLDG